MKRISESDQFVRTVRVQEQVGSHADKRVDGVQDKANKYIDNSGLKLSWWQNFTRGFANWQERRHTVKVLRGLSNSQLKDIGLSCSDVDKLYGSNDDSRRFWPHWPK